MLHPLSSAPIWTRHAPSRNRQSVRQFALKERNEMLRASLALASLAKCARGPVIAALATGNAPFVTASGRQSDRLTKEYPVHEAP
jgi:hypothetical protein